MEDNHSLYNFLSIYNIDFNILIVNAIDKVKRI